MKKLILISIAIIIILAPIVGRWDYKEYETLALISSMGIDYDKDSKKVTVTLQQVKSSSGQSKGSGEKQKSNTATSISTSTENTIIESIAKLEEGNSQKLFFGYLDDIILSEDTTKYLMKDIISFLETTPEIPLNTYVSVTNKKAKDLIKDKGLVQYHIAISNISERLKNANYTGVSANLKLSDLMINFATSGVEVVIPQIVDDHKPGEEIKEEKENPNETIKIYGLVAFDNDKSVGVLNAKETMGWRWITGEDMTYYRSIGKNNMDSIWIRIQHSSSKIDIKESNNKISIYIKVSAKAEILKYFTEVNPPLFGPKEIAETEQLFKKSIEEDIKASLQKAQKELKTDIYGFGYKYFLKHPYKWKNGYEQKWKQIYPDIPVSIQVDTKIINSGTATGKLEFK